MNFLSNQKSKRNVSLLSLIWKILISQNGIEEFFQTRLNSSVQPFWIVLCEIVHIQLQNEKKNGFVWMGIDYTSMNRLTFIFHPIYSVTFSKTFFFFISFQIERKSVSSIWRRHQHWLFLSYALGFLFLSFQFLACVRFVCIWIWEKSYHLMGLRKLILEIRICIDNTLCIRKKSRRNREQEKTNGKKILQNEIKRKTIRFPKMTYAFCFCQLI